MTEPSASHATSPWSVRGNEAAELLRLHLTQLLAYEPIPTELKEGAKAKARRLQELTLDEVPEDLRGLVAEYERSRPGVQLRPLRYIAIGGRGGTAVAGAAKLPDHGLVSLVITRTIADAGLVEVTSRILVARALGASDQAR